jgi:hypothetical protein
LIPLTLQETTMPSGPHFASAEARTSMVEFAMNTTCPGSGEIWSASLESVPIHSIMSEEWLSSPADAGAARTTMNRARRRPIRFMVRP